MNRITHRPKGIAAGLFLALNGMLWVLPVNLSGTPQAPKEKPKLERRSNKAPSNPQLEKQVTRQLRMLAYYSVFDNIECRVDGNRVELLGQVVQPGLKADAEAAVRKIEGVESVVNKIEVLPPSPNDDSIRLGCYRAILMSAPMQKYAIQPVPSIHIIVKNGNVTLAGVVDSESDKNLAYLQASGVHGAFLVTNHLRVEKPGAMTLSQTEVLNP
jgi:BON domain